MEYKIDIYQLAIDGQGHLYATDVRNKCLHVFSTEGRYLGSVFREKEDVLGEPYMIDWSNKTSSLIINHDIDGKDFISVVKVDM